MTTAVCSWALIEIHQKSGQTVSAAVLMTDLTASVKEKLKRNKSTKLAIVSILSKESWPWSFLHP